MELGKTLRRLRVQSGLTQQEVADRLDVSRVAIGQWESDRTMPRKNNLEQLSLLFGVTISELMGEQIKNIYTMKPSGTMMPLLGYAHMGEPCDEDCLDEMLEVPSEVAERHPRGFLVHAQGDCMDLLFPHDCVLLVDPDMEPVNGRPVLAETSDYGAVVRNLTRGATHCMLTAASHSGEYPDIMAGPDDDPITIKGRVVWYMRDGDDVE